MCGHDKVSTCLDTSGSIRHEAITVDGKDTLLSDSGPSFSTTRVGAELLTDRAWLLTDTRTNDLAIRISISLINLCDFTKCISGQQIF